MNSKMLQSELAGKAPGDVNYWQIFRDVPEPYLIFDATTPDFRIIDINKAREALLGVDRKEVVGLPFFKVYPDITPKFKKTGVSELRQHIQAVIRTKKPMLLKAYRYDVKDANGRPTVRYWQTTYTPLLDANGSVCQVVSSSHDLTAEMLAKHQTASIQGRLEAALTIGKIGGWLWDIEADTITSDKNLAKLFHLSKERMDAGLTIQDFIHAIHPEDRPRIERAIRGSIAKRIPFDEEYRVMLADGGQRWVLARGRVEDHDGRQLFPGVVVDITEQRDLQAQLELARRQDHLNRRAAKVLQTRNEQLEAIGHSKDEFVALASHQLRTPATAVKQYLGMVLQGYAGLITDLQADMLDKAFESNERQLQIINQILNAARADTGRLIMSPIALDLRMLVRGAWTDMRSLFVQRGLLHNMQLPRRPVMVAVDQGYMRMAVENLLHNACMYTPSGGTIALQLDQVGDMCRLSVTDTGVGIRKADFAKLFAKFSRIHNPLSVEAGGSGIGLYLASEIVRLHAGTIQVESKIHKGSTFAILLPLVHN